MVFFEKNSNECQRKKKLNKYNLFILKKKAHTHDTYMLLATTEKKIGRLFADKFSKLSMFLACLGNLRVK